MRQLILDLRGNSGGFLNAAVDVADKFITGDKRIVYTQGRIAGSSEEYFATDEATHRDFPLVVLIDAGSASASEIVSGAIQDWDRGIVAGHTSFGKALVQRQYRLRNEGALLLTVARYYTPSGRLIQRPYAPGERIDYYRHAGDNGDGEEGGAPSDTAGRPIFRTLVRGRPVYGGGGITPDEPITEVYRASRLNNRLAYERKYFDFTKELFSEQRIHWDGTFANYLDQFQLEGTVLDDFRGFLEADSFAFEPDTFAVYTHEVERGLRAEIARYLWGEEERYRILIRDDPALERALYLMPAAEAVLTESRRIEAEQQAARN